MHGKGEAPKGARAPSTLESKGGGKTWKESKGKKQTKVYGMFSRPSLDLPHGKLIHFLFLLT